MKAARNAAPKTSTALTHLDGRAKAEVGYGPI